MITANEARKAMEKVWQERENWLHEIAENWVHDVVNAAVAQACGKGEGHTPTLQANNEDVAIRAERILTTDPYNYKVVRKGTTIVVVWYEPSEG